MNKKVICLGEIMMRLSPKENKRLLQSDELKIYFGGAEANVAVLLANLGVDSYFATKVPENLIGEMILRYLRGNNVKDDCIIRGGERVGLYYFEQGAGSRNSTVTYDRKNSAMWEANVNEFDFESIFKDTDWFHVSGVTPALGKNNIEIVKKATEYCKANGIKISVDLNYRKKLWSYPEFKEVMSELIRDAHLCIGWIDLLKDEKELSAIAFKDEEEEKEYFTRVLTHMQKELNVKYIATTIRTTPSTSRNSLRGFIFDGKEFTHSDEFEFDIVDRVGAGDSFSAGLICELVKGKNLKEAIDFGIAAGVFKHTIEGDACIANYDEIRSVTRGMLAGGVAR